MKMSEIGIIQVRTAAAMLEPLALTYIELIREYRSVEAMRYLACTYSVKVS